MIHRNIEQLPILTNEIYYLDPITMDQKHGVVVFIEKLEENVAFVYVASDDIEENVHEDFGVRYRDIIVFDDYENENEDGSFKDPVLGMYGKKVGE